MQLECFNRNNGKRNVSELRRQAVAACGGDCRCCGESRINRLTLGHPGNDGNKHREITHTEKTFYRHLKKLGYPQNPDGFRIEVQCWNCNAAQKPTEESAPTKKGQGQARSPAYPPILNNFVPQTGHVPVVAGLPFFMVIFCGFFTSREALHFTQYAIVM